MKIAWFTPLSIKSAIGDYSNCIARRLSRSNDVDLWVADKTDLRKTELRIIDYSRAPEAIGRLTEYDAIVYNMGNNLQFYRRIYETAREHRGIVILHDRVLHHFFAAYYMIQSRNSSAYLQAMESFYGDEGRQVAEQSLTRRGTPIWERDDEVVKYPLFEGAIVNAEGVIVHSESHRAAVSKRWFGPVKTAHLPCFEEDLVAAPRQRTPGASRLGGSGAGDSRLLLLTVGHVNSNKHIHKVLEVLADHPDIAKCVRYVVLGPHDDRSDYGRALRSLIERHSLEGTVQLLGYQPEAVLETYLSEADIFVNLRLPAMESAPGSLLRELPRGKPILVFDTGFPAELPDDCLAKVRPGDFEHFARRLREMITNERFRDSIGAGGRKVATEFSVEKYATALLEFTEEVRRWRPILSICDRVGQELALMGADGGMKVLDMVAKELGTIFERDG